MKLPDKAGECAVLDQLMKPTLEKQLEAVEDFIGPQQVPQALWRSSTMVTVLRAAHPQETEKAEVNSTGNGLWQIWTGLTWGI